MSKSDGERMLNDRIMLSRIYPGHRASGLPDADVAAIIAISDAIAKWPGCSAQERDKAALYISSFTAHLSLEHPGLVKALREKRVSRIWYHLCMKGALLRPPIQMRVFLHDHPELELNAGLFAASGLTARIVPTVN